MQHLSRIPFNKMTKKDKGFICEREAEKLAVQYGYLPYTTKWEGSKIDTIWTHKKTGEDIKIDVKMASYRRTGRVGTLIYRAPSAIQKKLGVVILYIQIDENCDLKEHWWGNA